MNTRLQRIAVACATLALSAGVAHASADPSGTATTAAAAFASEFGPVTAVVGVSSPIVDATVSIVAPAVSAAVAFVPRRHATRSDAVRYEPRRHRRPGGYGPAPESFGQIHAGMFDPEGDPEAGFLAGFRGGIAPDPHVRVGGLLDWSHKQSNTGTLVTSTPGPGGTTIITERDVRSSTFDLVPFMVFVEYVPVPDGPVTPYVGIAGGGEWLHLSADDINIPVSFDADYAGWGWQGWIGASAELGPHARVIGELFTNSATVSRDAYDPILDLDVRESVDVDGTGVRFGISWGF
jgi:hypothetical protein